MIELYLQLVTKDVNVLQVAKVINIISGKQRKYSILIQNEICFPILTKI